MTRQDVIVAGAGPAGSATALLFARAGFRVLLLERARFPRDKPCSEYLSPESTRLLERLGVLEDVEASAPARLYGMKVFAPSGTEMTGRFASDHGYSPPRPYGFALPRRRFDAILRDAAERAGAEVREETGLRDLLYDRGAVGGVVARTPAGKRDTYRARLVVGADGLRSVVARRLGVRHVSLPRRLAFTAHLEGFAGVGDMGEMHIGPHGYVGLGPIGGGVTTVALVLPVRTVRDERRDYRAHFLAELERFPGLRGRVARGGGRVVREVLATGPFAVWSRPPVAAGGGAVLVGDAADFFDPFTGQGIFSALRGAELVFETLAPVLGAGAAPTRVALAAYARARRAAFAGKWLLERLIGLGVGWPALAERVVRRLAQRPRLADLLVGATGNFVPARAALAPAALLGMLW